MFIEKKTKIIASKLSKEQKNNSKESRRKIWKIQRQESSETEIYNTEDQ